MIKLLSVQVNRTIREENEKKYHEKHLNILFDKSATKIESTLFSILREQQLNAAGS